MTGSLLAFSGGTGTGKSTLGYGLGQRPGWQQVADDCIAFTTSKSGILLLPIPNAVRLRKSSAEYFGQNTYSYQALEWPSTEPKLDYIFFIQTDKETGENFTRPFTLEIITAVEAYPLLLQQAYALTLQRTDYNQRMMQDYLELTCKITAYRLSYPMRFSNVNIIIDTLIETLM
jgi:hypothetical protein